MPIDKIALQRVEYLQTPGRKFQEEQVMKTSRFISLLLCVVMIMSLFTGLAGSASADDVIVHEVQSGEILLKICEKHGLNYYACKNAIMALNGFASEADMGRLSVGQKIKLPASDAVAGTVSTSTAVVTSTTVGGTTMTTTTSYVGTTAAGGNIAYYLTAYTVQAGDTLAGICGKLNSNYYYYAPVILAVNSLANANYIRPGQVLLIPTPSAGGTGYAVVAHQVQPGETMTAICNRYGVSYQAMRTLINGLNRRDNMDKIYVGQTVYVPTTGAGAVSSAVVVSGTTTTTSSGTPAAGAGYTITFATGGAFASANGKDYVSSAPAGVEVSVWSNVKSGYAVKSLEVIRTDTGAPVPVDYNYFTMPNSNVYVDVAFEKGLSITKAKAQGGSFETSVSGFLSDAAFPGDMVTVLAYPNQYYSVKSVSYQKTDGTVSAVEVKKDASGNYSFTMPSYPIKLSVTFAPTQYHTVSYSGTIGNGKVTFTVGNKEVKQVEQGETVTMKFVPDKNWAFNTSDFENNIVAHIPNRSSMGSFKKIDDSTYTFVMGTKDINVVGVQFLNRSVYTISGSIWKGTNNSANGSIRFNVIDQTTGAISYDTSKAKFGDTVQVIYRPDKNYVNDAQYAKDNSKGAGNALLSWSSDNTFTMPDSNVTVNARFVQDGATHTYSGISRSLIPAAGGTVDFIFDGCVMDTAEVGKVVTVKVYPKPNYDISVAKIIGSNTIYAVSLNGKLVDEAPAASNFVQVDKNTFTFVKGSGTDTIRVAFASDYQGVNATFTQITEGGDPVVQGIKGFAINGSYVQGDAQVIYGDTVSFSIDLKEGYEITQVRKYAREKASTNEIAGTTALIPGGKDNSYSYTVTKDDVTPTYDTSDPPKPIERELVFEITARKIPETYYTVKYTQPKIDGATAKFVDDSTFMYTLSAVYVSSGVEFKPPVSADLSGISGNDVEANNVRVNFKISNQEVKVSKPELHQTCYYTFDKLLINGEEFAAVDKTSDSANYLASFILPKDAPDYVVTTEVVYKLYKTEEAEAITLKALTLDGADPVLAIKEGVFDYTVTATKNPGKLSSASYSATPVQVETWLNDVLLESGTDVYTGNLDWITGPNTLVIKLHKDGNYTDSTYTFTVNYAMKPADLTELKVDSTTISIHDGDPGLSSGVVTGYEATVTGYPNTIATILDTNEELEWILNGVLETTGDTVGTQNVKVWNHWQPGANTLELIVSDTTTPKSSTKYVFTINVVPEKTKMTELKIESVNAGENICVDGQLDYAVTVTKNPVNVTVAAEASATIAYRLNDDETWTSGSPGSLTLDNTIGKNTLQIKLKHPDKLETIYNIAITPNLDPAAMDIYLTIDGNMVKFKDLKASYSTTKETAKIDIKLNAATDTVTVNVNGTDYDPLTGATTVTAEVDSGKKVEKWNVGKNTVKFTVVGTDMKETVYTLNVDYKTTPLKLKTLTFDGVNLGLGTSQSRTTNIGTSTIVAEPEDPNATVDIRLNGTTVVTGTGTQTASMTWTTDSLNYVDIFVTNTGFTDGVYHIDVTHKTP